MEFIRRGRNRFEIFCVPCHGYAARGDGMVARRASVVAEATWNFDLDLHSEDRRGRAVGHLFNTITNGNQNMPAYGDELSERDRWAVVAYLRSLQASETQSLENVSAAERVGRATWPDYTPPPEPENPAGTGGVGEQVDAARDVVAFRFSRGFDRKGRLNPITGALSPFESES